MHEDEKGRQDLIKKSWLWSDCKLVLRKTNSENSSEESYQNLQAEVELESEDIQQPFVPSLTFDHTFQFDLNKGFSWKRGKKLPALAVKLQRSYFELLNQDEQIIMIYCELTVAYPSRKDTHFYLQQIRTLGQKRKMFSKEGQVEFNGIIIKESSHQKSNSKFSLLISICASSLQQNKIILKTLISTAFFVQNQRIQRKKKIRSKCVMKLISPNAFLKPLQEFEELEKEHTKERLLRCLEICNQNREKFSIKHPLYMIYHFSDIFTVHYNSKEILDLDEMFELIAPNTRPSELRKESKSKGSFISYNLKKTKKIKKSREIQQSLQKSQKSSLSSKERTIIQARIQMGQGREDKLLRLTFDQSVIELIQKCSSKQSQNHQFYIELEKQVKQLTKMLQQWTDIYMNVDLLKKQEECVYWKSVERQTVFQAYKNHYNIIYGRLTKQQMEVQEVPERQDTIY